MSHPRSNPNPKIISTTQHPRVENCPEHIEIKYAEPQPLNFSIDADKFTMSYDDGLEGVVFKFQSIEELALLFLYIEKQLGDHIKGYEEWYKGMPEKYSAALFNANNQTKPSQQPITAAPVDISSTVSAAVAVTADTTMTSEPSAASAALQVEVESNLEKSIARAAAKESSCRMM